MSLLQEFVTALAANGVCVSGPVPDRVSVRDRLLVIDLQHDFLPGGSFGVAEGDATVPLAVELMDRFGAAAAAANGERAPGQKLIFATRDYHPMDHCSFIREGGPFPSHCVQGTRGSFLVDPIAEKILEHGRIAQVVFKAYSKDADSFGAFQYHDAAADGRITRTPPMKPVEPAGPPLEKKMLSTSSDDEEPAKATEPQMPKPCYCGLEWTGASALFASNAANDANAPPDVMSVFSRVSLSDAVGKPEAVRTIYVCGLALDYCVLDTVVTAHACGYDDIVIVIDAARAAHIPGIGKHGSGFLSDPAEVAEKMKKANVRLMTTL